MPKVIAVRGVSNSGKTASIKRAREFLEAELDARVIEIIRDNAEIFIVLEMNGVIVVLASACDLKSLLEAIFERVNGIQWGILVCATKSYGDTVDFIRGLAGLYSKRVEPRQIGMRRMKRRRGRF